LAAWLACWRQGSSPEVRQRLTVDGLTDWPALDRVAGYLKARGVADRELTCYTLSAVPLYLDHNWEPSTPYLFLYNLRIYFPSHADEMCRAVRTSRQRFLVLDRLEFRSAPFAERDALRTLPEGSPGREAGLPAELDDLFPAEYTLCFRADRYLVFEVSPPHAVPGARTTP
jgi:hypothetical protein